MTVADVFKCDARKMYNKIATSPLLHCKRRFCSCVTVNDWSVAEATEGADLLKRTTLLTKPKCRRRQLLHPLGSQLASIRKRTLWTDSVSERPSPKKIDLLLRSRARLRFRGRGSFRSSLTRFSTGCPSFVTACPTFLTSGSTRFYPGTAARLRRGGGRGGCLGSGSLRRARRRCRISSKNAGISDKAEDHS